MTFMLLLLFAIFMMSMGIFLFIFFKEYVFSKYISIYLMCLALWQMDVAVLYGVDFFAKDTIDILFRIFRAGPALILPFLVTTFYMFVKHFDINVKGIYKVISNRYFLLASYAWGVFIYVSGFTGFQIKEVEEVANYIEPYLYPVYNSGIYFFYSHVALYIIISIHLFIYGLTIKMKNLRILFVTFYSSALMIGLLGILNFSVEFRLLPTSVGIVITSLGVFFAYMSFQRFIIEDIHERAKKQSNIHYLKSNTSTLLHELRNPITILKGFIDLLKQFRSYDEKTGELLKQTDLAVRHLNQIVEGYSDFILSGKMEVARCSIHRIVDESIQMMDIKAAKKKIRITRTYKGEEVFIKADEDRLRQVFINLIKNSIEAIPDDRERREIKLVIHEKSNNVIIDIVDTGAGIARDKWDLIFTPFESSKPSGMGLGLSIVHKIILAHNGHIEIVKSSSEGTHIQVTLPTYDLQEMFMYLGN
ncbi:MAG: HAMP domain-containing histidine kinase [Bacillaceae bacterium]|nr:HAMP domain-containing histidine kinase [Bacillaceae bacterium]